MPVYMIRAGEHGPVKIGFSDDVAGRLTKMQADNHERLTVLRIFEGCALDEASLHERFSDNWLHGEWHGFTAAMLGDVGLVEIVDSAPASVPVRLLPPPVPQSPDVGPMIAYHLCRLRRERGMTQAAVAVQTGIKRSSLAAIEAGHDQPGRDALLRLAAFFGVTVDVLTTAPAPASAA